MSRSGRIVASARRPSVERSIAVPADVSDVLDREAVRWCVLRDGGTVAESPDVDLLVRREDLDRVRRALRTAGFLELRSWGYAPHRFFFRPSEEGWTKLDIVTELRFGPARRRVAAFDDALERRIRPADVWRLAAGDEFWTLLLHACLDKPSIGADHRAALRRLAAGAGQAAAVNDATLFASRAEADALVAAVEQDRWDDLAAWAATRRGSAPWAAAAGRALARRLGWRLRPLRRPGVTVALLAPDGAGKTTIAGLLESTFPVPVRSIYMGLYRKPGRRLPPGVGLASRVALQWLRYGRAAYHRGRGRVVLFDRYTDDAGLPTPDAGGLDRARRRILARAIPRPDLTIVLDAPSDVLLARKGEHDVIRLERDRSHYRHVADVSPGAVVLDATRPPEAVAGEAAARIWSALDSES